MTEYQNGEMDLGSFAWTFSRVKTIVTNSEKQTAQKLRKSRFSDYVLSNIHKEKLCLETLKMKSTWVSNATADIMYTKHMNSLGQRESCIFMFIAALVTATKLWNQCSSSSVDRQHVV